MRKKKKVLFIEGSPDTSNGDLSKGFSKLLEKVLEGNMPKILMGGGRLQAINKFKNSKAAFSFLLIDLDHSEELREEELLKLDLTEHSEQVFFMVQEVEAWFISQPEMLDKFYGIDLSKKLKNKTPKQIKKPSELLKQLTKKTRINEEYHKVRHASALLKLLNTQQLRTDFEDFDRLIKKILNPTDK
ncbi:MAG: DUF4276 family protein [Bacteroidota bacterium]